jgi:hypothetical protein
MSSLDVERGPTRMKWRSVVVRVRMRWGGRGWISPRRGEGVSDVPFQWNGAGKRTSGRVYLRWGSEDARKRIKDGVGCWSAVVRSRSQSKEQNEINPPAATLAGLPADSLNPNHENR